MITVAKMRDLEKQVLNEEISYSRMVELINEEFKMKFQIDFNRETNDRLLKELGAKLVWIENHKYDHNYWEIEINSLQHLTEWLKQVEDKTGKYYSAIISIEPNTIYLDDKC